MKKKVYLIANAHIDPVWQWEWEEGVAATISTFRTAADLCDEFDNFIFCHNEAVLYKWVEEYEPHLFRRIQDLVKQGRWKIIGGWYLQPDCNMPCGESFVRQILLGRRYFDDKFGARPTTALNFDPFGHTRGLVQILKKSGYDSYVCTRPSSSQLGKKDSEADFDWIGFDGSRIRVRKATSYGSGLGHAVDKIRAEVSLYEADDHIVVLWGVGDHGGGPSRQDIRAINEFIAAGECDARHSWFEEFFEATGDLQVPEWSRDMNQFAVGCYTSIIRIKQKHRELENQLYSTEKMLSAAYAAGLMDYPAADLLQVQEDLCFLEFHDSLPGSSIQAVEEMCLRLADHALEILSRLKARAFFVLSAGEKKAADGDIPVLVYNPHPVKLNCQITCEMMLADQNWTDGEFTAIHVYKDGRPVPCQNIREAGNINLDWRKNVAFEAELEPFSVTRYDCKPVLEPKKEVVPVYDNGMIVFDNGALHAEINTRTGLMDSYRINGREYLRRNAFEPLVMDDNDDPWGMTVESFRDLIGRFTLMSDNRSTLFSGVRKGVLPAVRTVEDGDVRTVVEACLEYGDSAICMTYYLPKKGTQTEVHLRVYWNEKNKCLKLSIPTLDTDRYVGQTAFGKYDLKKDGRETVAQRWTAALSSRGDAVTLINDSTYGSDYTDEDGIRITLLRSASYTGHPIKDRPISPQDRFTHKIDQGERNFRFWLNAGDASERMELIDREAAFVSEKPFALSFFPSGEGEKPAGFMTLSDSPVVLSCAKKADKGEGIVVRLCNPCENPVSCRLTMECFGLGETLKFEPFEVRTFVAEKGSLRETNMIEE
ncbi:MAG: alpha-mannosidase [Abditibacteriota bacterium]|nr:alpha-mannosidase [Abditibacteriota bacterium]